MLLDLPGSWRTLSGDFSTKKIFEMRNVEANMIFSGRKNLLFWKLNLRCNNKFFCLQKSHTKARGEDIKYKLRSSKMTERQSEIINF